uniref:DNA polymerase delta small subunit n=1 Tax=Alexandrium monilatum TaxID=311494 RepID=A0A7S4SM14_9DINO|mmetsp:Transcript_62293/g.196698  ORF Transcript_62293/g.196698 Transcript_62293/m.196698 type:complete len:580 (+) Transcript_62293:61-1800(+)
MAPKKAKAKAAPAAPAAASAGRSKKKATSEAASASSPGGRGKRKAQPEAPQGGLLRWFTPTKAATTPTSDVQGTPAGSQGSGAGDAGESSAPPPVLASAPPTPAPEDGGASTAAASQAASEAAAEGAPQDADQDLRDDGICAGRQDFSEVWSSDKFGRGASDWLKEYAGVYASRLQRLRPPIEAHARAVWPQVSLLPAIREYRRRSWGTEVALVGILFKDMKSRPHVATLYRDAPVLEGAFLPEVRRTGPGCLCSDKDVMWLQDGTTRMELTMPAEWCAQLATGFVVAVRGWASHDGRFSVKHLCLAKIPPPPPLVLGQPQAGAADGHSPPLLALVSGLALGAAAPELAEARGRAVDFLLQSSQVQRLIVCGGLLAEEVTAGGLQAAAVRSALEEADELLAKLAAVLPVDVMPGPHDPTNLSLPQLPLHPYLFKRLRKCRSFKSVSNPYECSLRGGFRVLGHSGQPVEDLLRCTRLSSPIQALQCSLEGLHLAPTAPDSLPAQPRTGGDAFVIDAVPHILFSGGHDAEDHQWYAPTQSGLGTTCICVPAFHASPQLVLVNLHNPRDVHVPHFGRVGPGS